MEGREKEEGGEGREGREGREGVLVDMGKGVGREGQEAEMEAMGGEGEGAEDKEEGAGEADEGEVKVVWVATEGKEVVKEVRERAEAGEEVSAREAVATEGTVA